MTSPGFAQAVTAAMPPDNGVRVGEVLSVNPLRIDLAGGIISAGILGSYSPVVGDFVSLVRQDGTWLAVGATGDASARGGSILTAAKRTNAGVTNSTALTPDEELVLPVGVDAIYAMTGHLIFTATTVADIKWDLANPAECEWEAIVWTFQASLALGSQGNDTRMGINTSFAVPGNGTTYSSQRAICSLEGVLITGGTPGNLVVRFAQNTLENSTITLYRGSWIKLERMA